VATAGYCEQCRAYVWVAPDGSCQFGHPASGVTRVHEVAPDDAMPAEVAPSAASGSGPRRWLGWIVGGAAVVLVVTVTLGVLGVLALSRAAKLDGPAVPGPWKTRVSSDYPGWRPIDFESFPFPQSDDPPETDYIVQVMPPGESYNLGVMYQSNKGGAPRSDDEILRPAGSLHRLSGSLLAYLQRAYIARGKRVVFVTSTSDGIVLVNWELASSPASSGASGNVDSLDYDESTGVWTQSQ